MSTPEAHFVVGPKLRLALLWHQHQPVYRALDRETPRGSYRQPWVRLHTLRDYIGMPALIEAHAGVHATINLTPALLWQLDDYLDNGATNRALDLTLTPVEKLDGAARAELCATFFDAHWHNQILPHPRYRELFEQRQSGAAFTDADLTDLQMWSNLAWFGVELREGGLRLPSGHYSSVARFVEQGRGFSRRDIEAMVAEEFELMRAVVPLHRRLQDAGRIEVSTTPYYHPILPLLVDTNEATLDRPGTWLPRRFAHPEDAEAQVKLALADYEKRFGCRPRGMWPAEGAVSQHAIPPFAQHGVRWLATDQGVLERSGRFGYSALDPNVLCQPYRAEQDGQSLSIFFRDTELSDAIGFSYQHYPDAEQAAYDFMQKLRERFAHRLSGDADRVLTVALDGENPWGGYARDGRPFLDALYRQLEADPEIETVTLGEYLEGNSARGVPAHPTGEQARVHELFAGSWADEPGSASGIDLGTWIGEDEENKAWELLGRARDAIQAAGRTPDNCPGAYQALYVAEGSDWFWWYGTDQESGRDDEFDSLFREHLVAAYRRAGLVPPADLGRAIVPGLVPFTFAGRMDRLDYGSRLAVRTQCPGVLEWKVDRGTVHRDNVVPAGGVMAGAQRYQLLLGPFDAGESELSLRFRCASPACDREHSACAGTERRIELGRGRAPPATLRARP